MHQELASICTHGVFSLCARLDVICGLLSPDSATNFPFALRPLVKSTLALLTVLHLSRPCLKKKKKDGPYFVDVNFVFTTYECWISPCYVWMTPSALSSETSLSPFCSLYLLVFQTAEWPLQCRLRLKAAAAAHTKQRQGTALSLLLCAHTCTYTGRERERWREAAPPCLSDVLLCFNSKTDAI